MALQLKDRVENSLRGIRYHPDFTEEAQQASAAAIERFKAAGAPESMKPEIYSYACDAALMAEKYFRGRLEFLTRFIALLGERPEEKLDVAEDGCGSGVDLHVVHDLLGNKVSLTGIDKNQASIARAKARVPSAALMPDFQEGMTYDVIYSDYVSIDANMFWEVGTRGDKNFDALKSPGLVLQNADMGRLGMYLRFFGRKFSRVLRPELLATVPGNHDCYLCRFEKD